MSLGSRSLRAKLGWILGAALLVAPAIAAAPSRADDALELVLRTGPDARPVKGLRVLLGERATTSGPDGIARFEAVSPGAQRLVIAALGFERWERLIEVSAEPRERLEIALVPERLVRGTGRAVLREIGAPVVGASVRLQPLDVRSGVRGTLELTTDWDGRFALLDVPAGRYRAEIRAVGCAAAEREIELGAEGELVVELEPEIERAALDVEVVDEVGAPVVSAELVLEEALERGEIRRGITNAEGRCSFADLRVAARNAATREGVVRASRREVLLRGSAAGHRPAVAAVVLAPHAQARLVLAKLREHVEREPNDAPERALELAPGEAGRFRIARRGDRDWFALRLAVAGRVELRFGGAPGCDVHLQLEDERGQRLAARGASRGQTVVATFDLPAGRTLLRFTDWGDDEAQSVEQRFETRLLEQRLVAPPLGVSRLEPGGVLRAAWGSAEAPLAMGFALAQPAVVRFASNAAPCSRRLLLRARTGEPRGAFATAVAGAALVAEVRLAAGEHELLLAVMEGAASEAASLELRCEAIACVSRAEPRALVLDTCVVAGGVPPGEVDAFLVALPSAGVLCVRASTRDRQQVRVLGGDGAVLAEARSEAGGRCTAVASIESASQVRIELRADEQSAWAPDGVLLRTEWLPCEEAELGARDDFAIPATALELPTTLAGNLLPRGDVDVVRLDLERAGAVVLEGVAALPLDVRAFDAAGGELGHARFDPLGEPIALRLPAGSHVLKIRALDASAWSAAGYRLRLRVEPD